MSEDSRSARFRISARATASWLLRRRYHVDHDQHDDHSERECHNARDSHKNGNNKYYKERHGEYDDDDSKKQSIATPTATDATAATQAEADNDNRCENANDKHYDNDNRSGENKKIQRQQQFDGCRRQR